MTTSGPQGVSEFTFKNIQSKLYRVIHMTRAMGGPSPSGGIQMALYNERVAFPDETVHQVTFDKGQMEMGAEIPAKRKAFTGIIREVEVQVMLNYDTARALHTWLGGLIDAQQ